MAFFNVGKPMKIETVDPEKEIKCRKCGDPKPLKVFPLDLRRNNQRSDVCNQCAHRKNYRKKVARKKFRDKYRAF